MEKADTPVIAVVLVTKEIIAMKVSVLFNLFIVFYVFELSF